ncbi:TetR/AcrR family transcriptional regulator [Rhizobium tubonense]|uniref:TetR family transcriptional regulator n=1 Tax=Rhizobium tubonense TaxID=484088 RepID=A0A2W4CD99_9HYPH|nr:TetR/AcrR family transcriptional regulator [Rhizobium tubonense]PZM11142.1 TetR family transcriptional regulator [Rhizobium tubonense]
MGHSQMDKQRTHERIVEIAAKRLREEGLEGVGVADLMKEAGLTVGGFYKHFASRDELVAEAMQVAFTSWAKKMEARGIEAADVSLEEFMDSYLSIGHRDYPGDGCAFTGLIGDLARSDPKTRNIASRQIGENIRIMTGRMTDADADAARKKAILAVCAMAGAVGFARIVDDQALSEEILGSVKEILAEMSKGKVS